MAQPKIKFRFGAPRDGGHSLLKIVAFDFQGNSIQIKERYTFNGNISPESKKPQMYEKAENVEKGAFRNFDVARTWALDLWQNFDKTGVAHGYIADADYPVSGAIWQKFPLATLAKEQSDYLYCLRLRLSTGNYLELKTIGLIDDNTGELMDDWKSCLKHIQGQFTRWASYNTQEAQRTQKAMIFGDGKKRYPDTKDINLWKMDFNTQTFQFSRRGRKETLKIQNEAEVRMAQNFEEFVSNCIA